MYTASPYVYRLLLTVTSVALPQRRAQLDSYPNMTPVSASTSLTGVHPAAPLTRQVLLIRHAESEENVKEVQALRVVKKLVSHTYSTVPLDAAGLIS